MQLLSSEVILNVESEFALIVLTLTSQTITVDFYRAHIFNNS